MNGCIGIEATAINVAPNPFNNEVTVQLQLKESGMVTVAIYDALGNLISTIKPNEMLAAGRQQIKYDSHHLAKGIYLMHVIIDGETSVRKIVKM